MFCLVVNRTRSQGLAVNRARSQGLIRGVQILGLVLSALGL